MHMKSLHDVVCGDAYCGARGHDCGHYNHQERQRTSGKGQHKLTEDTVWAEDRNIITGVGKGL